MKFSVLFLLIASLCFAGHPRNWQTGKLTDSASEAVYGGISSRSVITQNAGGPPTVRTRTRVDSGIETTYQIVGKEYSYEASGFAGRKPLIVNSEIKFADEGDRWLYILDGDGKERRLMIRKKALLENKLTQPATK